MPQQHTPEQWQAIIKQWQASGLSAVAFCEQHHVVYHNFLYWRRKLGQSVGNKLVPAVPDLPLSMADGIELALPGGVLIRGIHSGNLTVAVELLRQL